MNEPRQTPKLGRKVIPLVGVVLGMGAMAWAAVPLYEAFCRVTGFGGTTQVADRGADRVLDREVTVLFSASTERDMPWEFRPVQTRMKVKIGETALAFFEAHNPTSRATAGTATFNVVPFSVGSYFTKIDCFCFNEQVLGPGETVTMPVTFFVDPEMVEDAEAAGVNTITLSYTFFETELDSTAALAQPKQQADVN